VKTGDVIHVNDGGGQMKSKLIVQDIGSTTTRKGKYSLTVLRYRNIK
jgi:hypothetical protein